VTVPTPPSLTGIDPHLVAQALEVGVSLEAFAQSVSQFRARCEPVLELLPSDQRARRSADDNAMLHQVLRANLRNPQSAERRLGRTIELTERATAWAKYASDGALRRCRRPQTVLYRSPGRVVPGPRWCKRANCQRCARQTALDTKIVPWLNIVSGVDKVMVATIDPDHRTRYRKALSKYGQENELAVGGFVVPNARDALVLHDAAGRRQWGDRADNAVTIEQALVLILDGYDKRIQHKEYNVSFFGEWARQAKAAEQQREAERWSISRRFKGVPEKTTFVAKGVLPATLLAETADDVGLESEAGAFIGDDEVIDYFLSQFELQTQDEIDLSRQRSSSSAEGASQAKTSGSIELESSAKSGQSHGDSSDSPQNELSNNGLLFGVDEMERLKANPKPDVAVAPKRRRDRSTASGGWQH
jgi:hypothetical protein